jgi:hypothetical protein
MIVDLTLRFLLQIMSDPDRFFKNYYQHFRGIEICIENKLVFPSLTLIYSGIDTFSWVAYGDISVRKRFTKWVENHMYGAKPLSPRPIDLYAARCAILHTLTPNSDLSKNNSALPICYAWGNASLDELEKSIDTLKPGQVASVHLNDLFESYRLGVANFLDTESDTQECKKRMSEHYSNLDTNTVSTFNSIYGYKHN